MNSQDLIINKTGQRNTSGNPDPTDPVDHLFDGAPVNDQSGRAGDPEHLPSPAGDLAVNADGIATNNREAVRENLGDPKKAMEDIGAVKQAEQAELVTKDLPGAPETK